MECITEVQFFLDLVLEKHSRKFEASPGHTNFWFCSCSCPVRLRNLDQFQPSFRVVEITKFCLLCHMVVPLMKCMNLCPTCHVEMRTEITEVNKNCYTFFLFLNLLNLVTVNFEYGSAYLTFISILDLDPKHCFSWAGSCSLKMLTKLICKPAAKTIILCHS